MTQEEIILEEIERRGGSINTFDLMTLGISQYQARLKGLREKLALKGEILTEGEKILTNGRKCFLYRLIRPSVKPSAPSSLFPENDECKM